MPRTKKNVMGTDTVVGESKLAEGGYVSDSTSTVVSKIVNSSNPTPMTPTNDALLGIIQDLQNQIKILTANQANQTGNIIDNKPNAGSQIDMNRWITVVHLLDNYEGLTTHMEISNRKIDFRKFGDTIRLRVTEFEELFYTYKSWFENNVVGLTKADEDLTSLYGIIVSDTLPINSAILSRIQNLPEDELEKLYGSLTKTHQDLIIKKWGMGYFEVDDETGKHPKNPSFKNIRRIRFLNDLSNGGLNRILEDIEYLNTITNKEG